MSLLLALTDELPNSGGYWEPHFLRRDSEQTRRDRIAYGILSQPEALEAIHQVAVTVIEAKSKPGLELNKNEQTAILNKLFREKGLIVKNYRDIQQSLANAIEIEVRQMLDEEAIVMLMFGEM